MNDAERIQSVLRAIDCVARREERIALEHYAAHLFAGGSPLPAFDSLAAEHIAAKRLAKLPKAEREKMVRENGARLSN